MVSVNCEMQLPGVRHLTSTHKLHGHLTGALQARMDSRVSVRVFQSHRELSLEAQGQRCCLDLDGTDGLYGAGLVLGCPRAQSCFYSRFFALFQGEPADTAADPSAAPAFGHSPFEVSPVPVPGSLSAVKSTALATTSAPEKGDGSRYLQCTSSTPDAEHGLPFCPHQDEGSETFVRGSQPLSWEEVAEGL